MKIVFAGTPQFSVPTLQALLKHHCEVAAVLTQPDRKQGRGQSLQASPVKILAESYQLRVLQPVNLRDPEVQKTLISIDCDLMIVVAYGLILPKRILSWPKYGCINVHASLLPRWRGASPIQHAIMMGDDETGIAIMQMDAGMDTGPVYAESRVAIDEMNAKILSEKLAALGAEALIDVLVNWPGTARAQSEYGVTYAPKLKKQDAMIDWSKSAIEIERRIRAFYPWPMAMAQINDQQLMIEKAEVLWTQVDKTPGTILSHHHGLEVACGQGILRILRCQVAGKRMMDWETMRAGYAERWSVGTVFTKV